jgi:ribonuclease-3
VLGSIHLCVVQQFAREKRTERTDIRIGVAKDVGKARMHILANTFEAFIGALYLDQGYDAATKFIEQNLFPKLTEIVEKKLWRDPKSLVQEKAQEILHVTPAYKVLGESGPDHDKRFVVGICFGADVVAEGRGKSKQEAETKAAEEALRKNLNRPRTISSLEAIRPWKLFKINRFSSSLYKF